MRKFALILIVGSGICVKFAGHRSSSAAYLAVGKNNGKHPLNVNVCYDRYGTNTAHTLAFPVRDPKPTAIPKTPLATKTLKRPLPVSGRSQSMLIVRDPPSLRQNTAVKPLSPFSRKIPVLVTKNPPVVNKTQAKVTPISKKANLKQPFAQKSEGIVVRKGFAAGKTLAPNRLAERSGSSI